MHTKSSQYVVLRLSMEPPELRGSSAAATVQVRGAWEARFGLDARGPTTCCLACGCRSIGVLERAAAVVIAISLSVRAEGGAGLADERLGNCGVACGEAERARRGALFYR